MRLRITKSAHSNSFSVIKSAYVNKKRTTVTVEKLGNEKYICDTYGVDDAEAWARDYVARLNDKSREEDTSVSISFSPIRSIPLGEQRSFNAGYLFLQDIYSGNRDLQDPFQQQPAVFRVHHHSPEKEAVHDRQFL